MDIFYKGYVTPRNLAMASDSITPPVGGRTLMYESDANVDVLAVSTVCALRTHDETKIGFRGESEEHAKQEARVVRKYVQETITQCCAFGVRGSRFVCGDVEG